MTTTRSRHASETQLTLLGRDDARDDHVNLIVYDLFGRVIDVIPAHLGDRHEPRERASLHEATLWSVIAAQTAAERLPPPT